MTINFSGIGCRAELWDEFSQKLDVFDKQWSALTPLEQEAAKTIAAMMLGFALAAVGMDAVTGQLRMTYGVPELLKGFDFTTRSFRILLTAWPMWMLPLA